MTEKERKGYLNVIRNYKGLLSTIASNIVAYDNWSDEFCRKEINTLYAN